MQRPSLHQHQPPNNTIANSPIVPYPTFPLSPNIVLRKGNQASAAPMLAKEKELPSGQDRTNRPTINPFITEPGFKAAPALRNPPLSIGTRPAKAKSSVEKMVEIRKALGYMSSKEKMGGKRIMRVGDSAWKAREGGGLAGKTRKQSLESVGGKDNKRNKTETKYT